MMDIIINNNNNHIRVYDDPGFYGCELWIDNRILRN